MRLLRFHLTVHGPYRPFEGHMIEIKTKFPRISRPETMRKSSEEFLWKSLLSDVCFLFPPSQIALAAILNSGNLLGYDIESYVHSILCNGDQTQSDLIIAKLKDCIEIVHNVKSITPTKAGELQEKVKQCMMVLAQKQQNSKRKSNDDDDGGAAFGGKRAKANDDDSDFDDD